MNQVYWVFFKATIAQISVQIIFVTLGDSEHCGISINENISLIDKN